MTTNIRQMLAWPGGYQAICREERNVAALLYHLLMHEPNLQRFLALAGGHFQTIPGESGIFFEYALLRDLWNAQVKSKPDLARRIILDLLDPPNRHALSRLSVQDFNQHFGVAEPSRDYIQSPGRWSLERLSADLANETFLRTCRFKWAFNIKPDIVIHTSHDTALCIETKLESKEGQYPASSREAALFKKRGIPKEKQTALQSYLLSELLGIETRFINLVRTPDRVQSSSPNTLTWARVFAELERVGCPPFVHEWLDRLVQPPSITRAHGE